MTVSLFKPVARAMLLMELRSALSFSINACCSARLSCWVWSVL